MTAPSCSIARAMALLLLAAAFVSPARGEGALAVAISDDGIHKGFAYALKLNLATAEDARKEAIGECKEAAAKNKVPPAKCRIVEAFKRSCIAVALDKKGQWAGWAVAKDEKTAQSRAVGRCKVGGSSCAVATHDCDK
jgi:hypothetical protein